MWNDHESKEQRRKLELYHDAGTWLSVLNHFPSSDPASLDQVSHWKPDPPACGKLLGTECDTHTSNLGFQLDSIATMGRKAVEQYGEKSEALVGVLTKAVSLDCDDQAAHAAPLLGKKRFREKYREGPWNQKTRVDSLSTVEKEKQVREPGVPGSYPLQSSVASLATD